MVDLYHYTESGLSSVFLRGVKVEEHRHHGQSVVIPDLDGLHVEIGRVLVHKAGLLTPEELRFIRIETGLSIEQVASLFRISVEAIKALEGGKVPRSWLRAGYRALYTGLLMSQEVQLYDDPVPRFDTSHLVFVLEADGWVLERDDAS